MACTLYMTFSNYAHGSRSDSTWANTQPPKFSGYISFNFVNNHFSHMKKYFMNNKNNL